MYSLLLRVDGLGFRDEHLEFDVLWVRDFVNALSAVQNAARIEQLKYKSEHPLGLDPKSDCISQTLNSTQKQGSGSRTCASSMFSRQPRILQAAHA